MVKAESEPKAQPPHLDKRPQVFYPANPVLKVALKVPERFIEWMIFSNRETKVVGIENLVKARQLLKEGEHLVFTPNHLSIFDHPLLFLALSHYGFADLQKKLVFVGRGSLLEDPIFHLLILRNDFISVSSPREVALMEREERRRAARHNGQALRMGWEKLKEGRILVVNPEATRSRTGALISGEEAVASFWHLPQTSVVPMGIYGTEKFPKPLLTPLVLSVGEPLPEEALRGQARATNQREVDLVMGKIASLLPPQYRGFYSHPLNSQQ